MKHPRGSLWRKWDLHVHTPASLVHNYSSTNDVWEEFFQDLEALPEEFKVLGINDYIFLDGYRRVLDARSKGRLTNIDCVLPVVELRVDKFGGSAGTLRRLNYHVIFSDELSADIIQQQFLNALTNCYQLSPSYKDIKLRWSGTVTMTSLSDLGHMIKESVPESRRSKFGPDLIEGFNNLNVTLDRVEEILQTNSYLQGRYITAIGKAEWADIKWNDQSIADKKDIINKVDLVFTAAPSIQNYENARSNLEQSEVNTHLLDCSDAHSFSQSTDPNRIGNCFTWIKADTSFVGLRQAINEFDHRVCLTEVPEKMRLAKLKPAKYIASVRIFKSNPAFPENWFDNHLELNHDLVAIVGNKGSGKSALTDVIALLANTKRNEFSFLTPDKFRNKKLASHYSATLNWEGGPPNTRNLQLEVPPHEQELVRYIPQRFFEKVCNEISAGEVSEFEAELKAVIFSHVPHAKRLGCSSLDELIDYHAREIKNKLRLQREELKALNKTITELERSSSIEARQSLEEQLKTRKGELEALSKSPPVSVPQPQIDSTVNAELETLRDQQRKLDENLGTIAMSSLSLNRRAADLQSLSQKLNLLEQFYQQTFLLTARPLATSLQIDLDELVQISITHAPITKQLTLTQEQLVALEKSLDEQQDGSLAARKKSIADQINIIQSTLDEASRKYQKYLSEYREWEIRKGQILGDTDTPDTVSFLECKYEDVLNVIPMKLVAAKKQRVEKVKEIYSTIQELVEVYRQLYTPVQEFIDTYEIVRQEYNLNFRVHVADTNFADKFLNYIDQGKRGSFYGTDDAVKRIKRILENHDLQTEDGTIAFLNEIIANLENDQRDEKKQKLTVASQLRAKVTDINDFYDFLFSLDYLWPRYELRLGEKGIQQLSPGERGALLLIFYLLVDKDDSPLIIDQPEDNLDNESIFRLLVPSIREAKRRRQIIMITHNPNLAVVCDAEQVVIAEIDKADGNRVTYRSGSIENEEINLRIQDILEGTPPAFDNRGRKYHLFRQEQ